VGEDEKDVVSTDRKPCYCLNISGVASDHLVQCLGILSVVSLKGLILDNIALPSVLAFPAFVDSVIEHCSQVTRLQFNGFKQLSLEWMTQLIQKCKSVRRLVFHKCRNLKVYFCTMCLGNDSIEHLTVMSCPAFSHSLVVGIFETHSKVSSIVSINCPNVSKVYGKVEFVKINNVAINNETLELKTVYSDARNVSIEL
jgi:hypothetical protein